eukprot:6480117-Prymnesium_polylepis.1
MGNYDGVWVGWGPVVRQRGGWAALGGVAGADSAPPDDGEVPSRRHPSVTVCTSYLLCNYLST